MITDEYHYTLYKREEGDRTNGFYYYSYYDENGKRIKRSTGLTNEKKARAYVNRLIAEGKFKEAPKVSSKGRFLADGTGPVIKTTIKTTPTLFC